MTQRLSEIAEDARKWAGEAMTEWAESIKDSPPAHVFTLLVGYLLARVVGWIL